MKRLIAAVAAGTMLAALPLAAFAHDDGYRRHGRGDDHRHGYHHGHGWKHGHKHWHKPGYGHYGPPRVVHRAREVTRIVERPVYVPPPVVHHPYPAPFPVNSVDIGFRIFF
ncbi:MAG: hypothetical protein M5U08_22100 [Burkholderiales bacterium]|nr:hypothetical protein [Burkholderiales bacterium]